MNTKTIYCHSDKNRNGFISALKYLVEIKVLEKFQEKEKGVFVITPKIIFNFQSN